MTSRQESRQFGPYRTKKLLGEGAMGRVWLAEDENLQREVALKEPKVDSMSSEAEQRSFRARFLQEAKTAAKLNHPNIVTIYAAESYADMPVIAMEYIRGITLSCLLEQQNLSDAEKQTIFLQLLEAVAHAHRKGIIHRDLKPDNIFIDEDTKHIKLGDFGIARILKDVTARLTSRGEALGTPAYMAPEQILDNEVDTRADVFALGVLAYELFVGANPFTGGKDTHYVAIIHRITGEGVTDFEQLEESAGDFSSLIKTALQKEPGNRFLDAAVFLREWEKVQRDLGSEATRTHGGFRAPVAGEKRDTGSIPVGKDAKVPDAPLNLTAVPKDTQIALDWQAPVFNGGGQITNYEIFLSDDGGKNYKSASVVNGNTTEAVLSKLSNGVSYHICVAAINAAGLGERSAVVSAIPVTIPAAPTNLVISAGDEQGILQWAAPSDDGGSPVVDYQISLDGGQCWESIGSTLTGKTVLDLENGRTYDVAVRAINEVGTSAPSELVSFVPATIPNAPEKLSAGARDGEVALSWKAPSFDGGSALIGYEIFQSSDGGKNFSSVVKVDSSVNAGLVSGLSNGESFLFYLTAINAFGSSGQSNVVAATPIAASDAPTDLTVTLGSGQATLSWKAPKFDGGAPIEQYQYSCDGGGSWTNTGSILTATTVTDLKNGTEYNFVVRAVNLAGVSELSNCVTATPATVPSEPGVLVAEVEAAGQVVLSWEHPLDDGGAQVKSYEIFLSSDGGRNFSSVGVVDGAESFHKISDLADGLSCQFYVVAKNDVGTSAQSGMTEVVLPKVPEAPVDVVAKIEEEQQVILSWKPPVDDGGSPITDYEVSKDGGETWMSLEGSSDLSCTFDDLSEGESYAFTVRAVNAVGLGILGSAEDIVIPIPVPAEEPESIEIETDESLEDADQELDALSKDDKKKDSVDVESKEKDEETSKKKCIPLLIAAVIAMFVIGIVWFNVNQSANEQRRIEAEQLRQDKIAEAQQISEMYVQLIQLATSSNGLRQVLEIQHASNIEELAAWEEEYDERLAAWEAELAEVEAHNEREQQRARDNPTRTETYTVRVRAGERWVRNPATGQYDVVPQYRNETRSRTVGGHTPQLRNLPSAPDAPAQVTLNFDEGLALLTELQAEVEATLAVIRARNLLYFQDDQENILAIAETLKNFVEQTYYSLNDPSFLLELRSERDDVAKGQTIDLTRFEALRALADVNLRESFELPFEARLEEFEITQSEARYTPASSLAPSQQADEEDFE